MNIIFISDFKNMTYEHYLTIPKPRIEWSFNILLSRNPELTKMFDITSHPLIRKKIKILLRMMKKIKNHSK